MAGSLATVFRGHADPSRKAEVDAAQVRINAVRDLSNSYVQIPAIKAMVAFRHGAELWTRTRPPLVGLAPAELADLKARAGLLLAAHYGGICLGPVNTAAGHALAYPLGTRLKLPHGLANAIIFPHMMAFNAPAVPEKTEQLAALLGLRGDLLDAASAWYARLGVKMRLGENGATGDELGRWAAEAHGIRRLMDNTPRDMSMDEIETIYRAAL